jgi:hypothetical protein
LDTSDCNQNGIPDEQEIASGTSTDCDGDLVLDECQIASDPSVDCDQDGTLDSCQISSDPSLDCNGDSALDACQIADDPSLDQNTNGILDSCECFTSNYCLAVGNSNGTQGLMSSSGSLSVTDNTFALHVEGSMPLQPGMMFYGTNQQAIIYGEGVLCVVGPLHRLRPIVLADSSGNVSYQMDFTGAPAAFGPGAINAFSTWNFQFWYRDPQGGPAGFNFSDGLEITFCP